MSIIAVATKSAPKLGNKEFGTTVVLTVMNFGTTTNTVPALASLDVDCRSSANAKFLATGTFKRNPVIAYSDSSSGILKLATYAKKKWSTAIIDGNSTTGGKFHRNLADQLAMSVFHSKLSHLIKQSMFFTTQY
jgi:acetylornithine deacetylase/succinyl-diaminopimelate desuccinylase-like protein